MRKEYIKRLISGVREEIEKVKIDTTYGRATPSTHIDAELLCTVIEEEILDKIEVCNWYSFHGWSMWIMIPNPNGHLNAEYTLERFCRKCGKIQRKFIGKKL